MYICTITYLKCMFQRRFSHFWIRNLVQQVVGWEKKPPRASLVFLDSASVWQKKCRCLPDRNTKVTNDKSNINICLQQRWQSRGLREKATQSKFSVPWFCFSPAEEMQMSARQKYESYKWQIQHEYLPPAKVAKSWVERKSHLNQVKCSLTLLQPGRRNANVCQTEIRKLKMTNPAEISPSSKSGNLGEDRNGVLAARPVVEKKCDHACGFVRCTEIQ